jgi:uncharacterized protein (DUF2147 family)
MNRAFDAGRAVALALCLLLPLTARPAETPDAIVGTWLTADGGSKVQVVATRAADGSTVYNGQVVWLKEPQRDGRPLLDANNADAAQRGRPIMGLPILSGFKAVPGGWGGGSVYSPRAGKSFPADLALQADGRLQLKVKAGMLSRTDYWTH